MLADTPGNNENIEHLYADKNPATDRCPSSANNHKAEQERKLIKNCPCPDCLDFKNRVVDKQSESANLRSGLMNRRRAIAVIFAGAGLGAWFKARHKQSTLEASQPSTSEKPKTFPKTLEVQGIKVQLDASWNDYPTPEAKTVEGMFQTEFQQIHRFYLSLGIDLKGREFSFDYDPHLKELGVTDFKLTPYSKGTVENNECDEQGKMKSMQMFMKDETPKPLPVKLKVFRGSTITHEIFHVLQGPYLYSTELWAEGIAHALHHLYEKQFPGSEIIQNSDRQLVEKMGLDDALEKEFFRHPDVQKFLFAYGYDENWILQGCDQSPKYSANLPRQVAALRWRSFLEKHPDFIAKFLQKNEEITRECQDRTVGDKNFIAESNERQLEAIGHLAAPEYFWEWMSRERIFRRSHDGEKIEIAFFNRLASRITVVSGKWVNEVISSSIFPDSTTTIARLSPRAFTIVLFSGKEIPVNSGTLFTFLDLNRNVLQKDIRCLLNFEGKEIPIVK